MGLLWGSFANVLIVRIPAGEQWARGSSRCPRCSHDLAWFDNIPVVSWVLLRGKCRYCSQPISAQYPVVELAVAALWAAVAWRWGVSITSLTWLYLAIVTVALAAIDLKVRRLPNALTYPSYAVVGALVVTEALVDGDAWLAARSLIGALVLGGFYGLMWLMFPQGMGLGDVKAAGFLGLALGALGWPALAVGAIAGPLIGGLYGVVAIARSRKMRGVSIPYGPWLMAGAWLGAFAGAPVADWYLGLAMGA